MSLAYGKNLNHSLYLPARFNWQLRSCVRCLGLAIAASPLTSTRFVTGLGATDLFLGITLVATLMLLRLNPPIAAEGKFLQRGVLPLFQFWLFALPLLVFSTLLNAALSGAGYRPYLLALVSFVPIALLVVTLYFLAARPYLVDLLIRSFLFGSLAIGCVYTLMVVTHQSAYFLEDVRFMGLSENPNQVADEAFSTILVVLLYPILFPTIGWRTRVLGFVTGVLTLIYGVASDAVTFFVSLIVLGGLCGPYLFFKYMKTHTVLVFIGLLLVLSFAIFNGLSVLDFFGTFFDSAQRHKTRGDEDVVRYILWGNGITAGLASPFIGNGAGAWSGLQAPFHETESHNSFIDWFTITGIPGLAFWLFAICALFVRFRWINPLPYFFFFSILVFSSFHFVFRHPFFWFASALCAMAMMHPYGQLSSAMSRKIIKRTEGHL